MVVGRKFGVGIFWVEVLKGNVIVVISVMVV